MAYFAGRYEAQKEKSATAEFEERREGVERLPHVTTWHVAC